MAVVIITHDLGVVAEIADDIAVMYAGRIVEHAPTKEIFGSPQHPYTWGLLGSITRLDRERPRRLPSIPGSPPSLIDPPQAPFSHAVQIAGCVLSWHGPPPKLPGCCLAR